jgi:ribonuclease R
MSRRKRKKGPAPGAAQGEPRPAGGGGAFGSFEALRRAAGGEQREPTPEEQRGWTLEVPGGTRDPSELPDDPGSRDRIDRRPAAFGPMETGPAVYRDEDSEEMSLLASFRVRTIFPADVLREVRSLPRDPSPRDCAGRLDLRERTIFTIDGDDAKDFDDAISIEELDGGRVEIGVHIADVAHYVRPETALDAEALARGTSVYLPDQVIPMLPEELSNHLCSLVEGRDRLAYSVFMVFDAQGARRDARVAKSVIRSAKRNTYRVVQELLDGVDSAETRAIRPLEPALKAFQRWTTKQQALRDAKGSLRLPSRERRFVFDGRGEVSGVIDAPRYFSMTLIEETALAANQAVGDLFRSRGLPTIYRVHPEKDPEEVEAVARLLSEHGIRVPDKQRLTGRDIGRMIRAARARPNAEALIGRIMGLIERAVYEVHDHEDVATHFGLAREAYLHFTSPIRRYPDLMVHRWLWALESRGAEAERELRAEELVADLNDVAAHSSAQAEVAEMAATAVGDLKVCQYMHPHVGQKLAAKVLRVSPAGIEVDLVDFNVAGFLPARAIGERVEVKGPTIQVRRGRRSLSFSEGHPIAVRLRDVDFIKLQLYLELA